MNTLLETTPSELQTINQLNQQAWVLTRADAVQAVVMAQEALEQSKAHNYPVGEGQALRTKGFAQYLQANHEAAFTALSMGRDIAHGQGDWATERDCLNYLGAVYSMLGELDSALKCVQQSYQASMQLEDPGGVAASLNNLGNLYDQMGRHVEALESKLEAVEITRQNNDQSREVTFWGNLVVSYNHLGRYEQAVESANSLLVYLEQQNRPDVETRVLVNLGEALGKLGRYDDARAILHRAEKNVRELGMTEGEVYCALNMALVYLAEEQPKLALEVLHQGLAIAKNLEARELQSQVHQRLSKAYQLDNGHELALEHYQNYHTLERELRAEQVEGKMRVFGTQRALEKAQAEAEIERLRNVELKKVLDALEHSERELRNKTLELEVLATQDPLTQLYNRRYLEQSLSNYFHQAKEGKLKLAVMLCDVDHFKQVNDTFSHQVGDVVLQTVAHLMREHSRTTDIVARYGGEEFVLVMPHTTLKQAVVAGERMRQIIQDHEWAKIHPNLRVTISLGLTADIDFPNHEKMLDAADTKLYAAKRAGRNRLEY